MVDAINEIQEDPLPIFPLNVVLFPGMQLPLHIFEERYLSMIEDCLANDSPFGVTLIQNGHEVGGLAEPHLIGTTARITDVENLEEGQMNIQVIGERRFRLLELLAIKPYPVASVHLYNESEYIPERCLSRLVRRAREAYLQYAWSLNELIPDADLSYRVPEDPLNLANFIASRFETIGLHQRQLLLEILGVEALLNREICWLTQEERRLRISLVARKKLLELQERSGKSLKSGQWLN